MAAKVPDSISERIVIGSRSMMVLTFSTTNLDTGDTVNLAPYHSTVEGAWFAATTSAALGFALSGTGNTTLTVDTATNLEGKLFVVGNP